MTKNKMDKTKLYDFIRLSIGNAASVAIDHYYKSLKLNSEDPEFEKLDQFQREQFQADLDTIFNKLWGEIEKLY